MAEPEQRIMRIVLPVPLIRAMDAVIIKGLGGYTTRGEFIVDAIQERVLEMTVDEAEDSGPPATREVLQEAVAANRVGSNTASTGATLRMTAIVVPAAGFTVEKGHNLSRAEGLPLFGLHNRDYPSLWALARLAALTVEGPIPAEAFYSKVTEEAWRFGELLLAIEKHTGTKRTALFPTNAEKRKAAEMGFRTFAIGDYRNGAEGTYTTSGPLFEWQVAGLIEGDRGEPNIGVTAEGWSLLKTIDGVSVEEPHPMPVADRFLTHLLENAPADRAGFIEILRSIGTGGATRQEVLEHVAIAWTEWSENEVSTNSAGYIARGREWGLIEPKQSKSKYHLTPTGIELVNGVN